MSLYALDPADVDALVKDFNDAGLPTDLDPAKVVASGAWLQIVDVRPGTLAGDLTCTANLVLVTGDADHRQALGSLAELWDKADPVLEQLGGVTGPARFVTVTTSSGPLPGLSVPFEFDTE